MPTARMSFIGLIALTLAMALGGSTVQAQHVAPRPAPSISPGYPAREVNSTSPVGNWFPISPVSNAVNHRSEWHPAVAYNSQNQQYLTAWDQGTSSGENYVYMQLVSRVGGLVGSRYLVPGFIGVNGNPDVAFNPGRNEYLVVFTFDQSTSHGLYGQRLDAQGSPVGSAITIASSITDQFYDPAVAFESDTGQYLVAWERRQGVSTSGIEVRALSGDGTTLGSLIQITGMLADIVPGKPDVACTRTLDECLVVWHQWYAAPPSDHDIFGQRVHLAGGAHEEASIILIFYSTYEEGYPSVSAITRPTGIGQYLVVCAYKALGVWSTVGQLLTDAGAISGGTLNLGASNGIAPGVAGNESSQEYLVAWTNSAGRDMQARTVSTQATLGSISQAQPASTVPLYPAIAGGPVGDFMVAYQDNYSGYPIDVFGWLWGTRLHLPLLRRD